MAGKRPNRRYRPCGVAGCPAPRDSHGFCRAHVHRFKRYGDPLAGAARRAHGDPVARFLSNFTQGAPAECWEWRGNVSRYGYGRTSIGRKQSAQAHRFSYEHFIGPIPEGLTLDHLCRNTRCVNPAHLEPVTASENQKRALAIRWRHALPLTP